MAKPSQSGRDDVETAFAALLRHWPRLRRWLRDDDAVALWRRALPVWERHEQEGYDLARVRRRVRRLAARRPSTITRRIRRNVDGAPSHLDHDRASATPGERGGLEGDVEVAHEALIRHWPRLRAWLDEDRTDLLLRESVREAAQEWERHDRDESYLAHRGRRLVEAEALAHHPRFTLNTQEQAYLDAAVALRKREEQEREAQRQRELEAQRERAELAEAARHEAEQRVAEQAVAAGRLRRRLMIAVGLGALALLAAVGAFWGFRQAGEQQAVAEAQRGVAEEQRAAAEAAAGTAEAERTRADEQAGTAEAERAVAVAERDRADEQSLISLTQALAALAVTEAERGEHERAALLARQAYLVDETNGRRVRERVDAALRAALGVPHFSHSLRGHEGVVHSLAFAPDGRLLTSDGSDGTIRLLDLTHPDIAPVVLRTREGGLFYFVAFAPDGRRLASASDDGTVRLWDLANPQADPINLEGHEGGVRSVAFAPDGRTLASGSSDGTVRLWDLDRPEADPIVLFDREVGVWSVAFAPDGRRLASGSQNGTVRLSDLTNPETDPVVLEGHQGPVSAVAFAPDGRTLVSGGWDGTVRLWDLTNPEADPVVLEGQEDRVYSVAFAPSGRTLAAAGQDGTVRIWDLDYPNADPVVLRGHQGAVRSIAFSPDGRLASGGEDTTVRLWMVRTETLADLACTRVWRNLTLDEWRQFVGDPEQVPYQSTCPDLPPGNGVAPAVATPV